MTELRQVKGWPEEIKIDKFNILQMFLEGKNESKKELGSLRLVCDEGNMARVIWDEDYKNGGPGSSSTRDIIRALRENIVNWLSLEAGE